MKLSLLYRGNIPDAQNLKIRYRHKNVMVLINTDITINPKHFQNVHGKWIKPTAANHITTNINIQKAWGTVEDFCNKYYYDNNRWPEPQLVKNFAERDNNELTSNTRKFTNITADFLRSLSNRDNDSISSGTVINYTSTFSKAKKFIALPAQKEYGDVEGNIFLDKIDMLFYYNFKTYLRKEHSNGDNTISATITRFKTFLYWAIKNKYTNLDKNMLEEWDCSLKDRDIIFHTNEEMSALFKLDLSKTPALDRHRDTYCLQAVMGFRHSDTDQNRWRLNLDKSQVDFLSKKTGNYVSLWLTPEAVSLIRKYHDQGKPFPFTSSSGYNLLIKDIGEMAGIKDPVTIIKGRKKFVSGEVVPKYKLMSSHVARATFICSLINQNIAPAIAAEMAGINVATLDYYVKVMDTTVHKAGQKVYEQRGDLRVVHLNTEKSIAS